MIFRRTQAGEIALIGRAALMALAMGTGTGGVVGAQDKTPAGVSRSAPPAASSQTPSGATGGANSNAASSSTSKSNTPASPTTSAPPATGRQNLAAPVTMSLKKSLPGEFLYRFVTKTDSSQAPVPLTATGADNLAVLPLPAGLKPADAQLEIIDTGRGNLARLPIATTGVTELTESGFKFVQSVSVPVQTKGKGVVGASVALTSQSKSYNRSVLLTPANGGVALFENVPLGEPVTVTVRYGAHPAESQTKTLTTDHPAEGARWSSIEVDWPDARTVSLPAPASSSNPNAPSSAPVNLAPGRAEPYANDNRSDARQSGGGFFNSVASTLVSLLFLGGVGYGLYWAYNTGKLKTVFDRLGIQTAPLTDAGVAAPNPFTAAERKPITPITEGTADPLAGGVPGGAAVGGVGAVPTASPRLIATMGTYAGNIYPLTGATLDIGRDTSAAIALPNDTNASRRHAIITGGNGQYTIMDNNSSNGTYLNSVRVPAQSPQPLRPGDEINIGNTRFRFEAS